MSEKKFMFLSPRQYNEIYSDSSGIIINREIPSQEMMLANKELAQLKSENEMMREALESIAINYGRPSQMMTDARGALEKIKQEVKA